MATKIVTKNSSTGGAVPSASDLVQGELAVNVADKRLFTEDNGGSIIELGTKPSTIDINAGTIDGTAIGASSASTGVFTTLTASGAFTSVGIDDNADATAITIDSSENVGIGNSSPSTRLTVGAGSGSEQILVDAGAGWADLKLHSDATNGGSIYFNDGADAGQIFYYHPENSMRFHTNATEKARLTSDGNLGIGTSAIMQDFGGGRTTLALKGAGSTDYSTLQLGNYGTSSNGQIHGLINFYDGTTSVSRIQSVRASNTSDAHLAFYTAPSSGGITERMRIDSSGNVGIGTSPNASADLHVADTSDARIWLDATSGDTMELYAGTNVSLFNRSNNAVTFGTNNTERMRIDSSGNMGVGTTSPQEMIHAYSASTSAAIRASGNGNNNSKVEIGYHATNGPYIKAGSSGVTGLQFYRDNTVLSAEIHRNTGDFYTNDGTISSLSDSRVKENIQDLADGLEVVKQLKPKTFKYNKKATFYDEKTKDIIRYGFIADEVQEVAPQYTQVGKGKIDGVEVDDLKSLSTTKMIPMLVKAIQEQQTLIESLTARIAALEE